jgi:hypothetical protein
MGMGIGHALPGLAHAHIIHASAISNWLRALPVVEIVRLGISIIKKAPVVVVLPRNDHVYRLWLLSLRDSGCVVVSVSSGLGRVLLPAVVHLTRIQWTSLIRSECCSVKKHEPSGFAFLLLLLLLLLLPLSSAPSAESSGGEV